MQMSTQILWNEPVDIVLGNTLNKKLDDRTPCSESYYQHKYVENTVEDGWNCLFDFVDKEYWFARRKLGLWLKDFFIPFPLFERRRKQQLLLAPSNIANEITRNIFLVYKGSSNEKRDL